MPRHTAHKGKDAGALERRIRVLELRKSGASFESIRKHLLDKYGIVVSRTQVFNDFKRSMKDLRKKEMAKAEQLRDLELLRLDSLFLANWTAGMKGDLGAGWLLLAISRRRAEIEGMDAPTRGVNLNITPEELAAMDDADIDKLIEQLNRR